MRNGRELLALAERLDKKPRRRRRRQRKNEEPEVVRTPEELALIEAKKTADKRVAFYSHLVTWAAVVTFLTVVADPGAGLIVGLAWGIGLAIHGFNSVIAPNLRQRYFEEDARANLAAISLEPSHQRAIMGRHAKSLEHLSASIAHEIRNPITAAKSLVQQMGEDPASTENVEYAKVALDELDRVEKSISHLLRYAREEETQLEEIDLSQVAGSALETFRDRVADAGVELTRDIEAPLYMQGDAEQMRRVVINLVSNAIDALEESEIGARTLSVAAGHNLAGTELWLRIKDNGQGIPKGRVEKIFSPFHTSKSGGTGLGLPICKKLIEAHGGEIDVTSDFGVGTEFVIRIPRVKGARLS